MRAFQPEKKAEEIYLNCSGEYLVWGGTRQHPHADVVKFSGIKAVMRGNWFTLFINAGKIRKNKTTTGFLLRGNDGNILNV